MIGRSGWFGKITFTVPASGVSANEFSTRSRPSASLISAKTLAKKKQSPELCCRKAPTGVKGCDQELGAIDLPIIGAQDLRGCRRFALLTTKTHRAAEIDSA